MTGSGNLLIWQTHEEAGCTDPHCTSGHARLAPAWQEECAVCGLPFAPGEDSVRVLLTPLDAVLIEAGAVMAETARYHAACYPGDEAVGAMRAEIWPPAASLEVPQ
jgi:hypothetical protein